jgi:uncharacterized coiled-coil protein SlyX
LETVIAGLLEKTLVGGAFIYLLHYFVNKQSVTLEGIANTLLKISNTLTRLDTRMGKLENRVEELEEKMNE